jgi:Tfp pilus assembly major pilin PilA
MKAHKGFTLVELMISMGVTMVLMGAVYMAVNATQRSSSAIERKVTAQQDVKPALDLMAMEIGMASYNPMSVANLWVNPTGTCSGVSANQAYRGIQEATANSIAVEMDICGTGTAPDSIVGAVGANGGRNEIIRYNYDTVNQYITRETNCGGGQPFLGDIPTRTRAVRVINSTLNIPLFRFYDGMGADISAGLPAGIPNIRRIDITLAVETENVDPDTNLRRRLIYSTSVIPRNHAIQ